MNIDQNLFVHYQERSNGALITDDIMSLEEYHNQHGEECITEHFLNNVGVWSEDWSSSVDHNSIDARIVYVVSRENLSTYKQKHNL